MKHARKDYNERIQDNANLIPADEPVFLIRGHRRQARPTLPHGHPARGSTSRSPAISTWWTSTRKLKSCLSQQPFQRDAKKK